MRIVAVVDETDEALEHVDDIVEERHVQDYNQIRYLHVVFDQPGELGDQFLCGQHHQGQLLYLILNFVYAEAMLGGIGSEKQFVYLKVRVVVLRYVILLFVGNFILVVLHRVNALILFFDKVIVLFTLVVSFRVFVVLNIQKIFGHFFSLFRFKACLASFFVCKIDQSMIDEISLVLLHDELLVRYLSRIWLKLDCFGIPGYVEDSP